MKFLNILTIGLLLSMVAQGQENQNEYRSIFNKKADRKVSHGAYGSFGVGYTSIAEKEAILLNFKGAWVINHSISFGFAGTGFFNNLNKGIANYDDYLGGGYGGFYFEPILLAKSPVHFAFPILIGGGGISSIPYNYWDWNWDNTYHPYNYDYDVFFLVEPGVELELNMVKFFRIAIGASYRWTNGIILQNSQGEYVPKDVMDGANVYINFKFGKW